MSSANIELLTRSTQAFPMVEQYKRKGKSNII
jgi:hypothetical protein